MIKLNITKFKILIEEFCADNFFCDGCKFCHENATEIMPDDWKGSYNKEIRKLAKGLNISITLTKKRE